MATAAVWQRCTNKFVTALPAPASQPPGRHINFVQHSMSRSLGVARSRFKLIEENTLIDASSWQLTYNEIHKHRILSNYWMKRSVPSILWRLASRVPNINVGWSV